MRIPGDGSRILCGASDVRRVTSGALAALEGAVVQGAEGETALATTGGAGAGVVRGGRARHIMPVTSSSTSVDLRFNGNTNSTACI